MAAEGAGGEVPIRVNLAWTRDGVADPVQDDPEPWTGLPAGEARPRVEVVATEPTRLGRTVVEGFDRLSDRVLEQVRTLWGDLDTELASLRSDVAGLRGAVDDLGERVQLRRLRATIDELRGDVAGLRRAVLDWPELEQVSENIATMRADMAFVVEALSEAAAADHPRERAEVAKDLQALRGDLHGIQAGIARLEASAGDSQLHSDVRELGEAVARLEASTGDGQVRGDLQHLRVAIARLEASTARQPFSEGALPFLAPLIEEMGLMREEMAALRRRVGLRAPQPAPSLDRAQLEVLADLVSERLGPVNATRPLPGRRR